MPLEICPKCKRFHYVPGACPIDRVVGTSLARSTVTPLPKPSTKKGSTDDKGHSRGENQQGSGLSPPSGKERPAPRATKPKAGPTSAGEVIAKAEATAAHLAPKKRGRPKGDTDRKAYQRELMQKRRAKLKGTA